MGLFGKNQGLGGQGSRRIIFIVENNKQLKYGQISEQEIRDVTVDEPESL